MSLLINHPEIVNINIFGFEEEEIKQLVGVLYENKERNKELIKKLIKFGNYIKRCNHSG